MSDAAPLRLVAARLVRLRVEFDDEALKRQAAEDNCRLLVEPSWRMGKDSNVFVARLHIRCLPEKDVGQWRFERIEVIVEGQFAYAEDVDEEERARLAILNAPAILHGIARGLIASATGLCVGGPFLLPTVNYVEVAKRMARKRPRKSKTDSAE